MSSTVRMAGRYLFRSSMDRPGKVSSGLVNRGEFIFCGESDI